MTSKPTRPRVSLTVNEVLRFLDERAPAGTAEPWDNVGLLAGDGAWRTAGAVVCVDLTREAIEEARARGYRLIVNHHPCIFPKGHGLSRITASGSSALVFEALRHGIAVIASHTNFDQCAMEVPEAIATGLGFEPKGRLVEKPGESLLKLAVFVPREHLEKVRTAICEAGAGHIGRYDFCTFGAEGIGTFRGGEGTSPFLGKSGRLEKAEEIRLETVFPRGLRSDVLQAMKGAHPYEEVAYDLIPVEQPPAPLGLVRGLGYGVWGEFSSPQPFSHLAKSVRRLFNVDGFWLTAPEPAKVRRIAFVAGKGSSFLDAATALQCDLFITGETGYHAALNGTRRGTAVMELGHRESECFFLTTASKWIESLDLKVVKLDQKTQKIWVGGKK